MNKEERFLGIRYNNSNGICKRRFWLIGSMILIVAIIFSLYFFSKTVTAQRDTDRVKMVTSVEIKKGDTLWDIAQSYITDEYKDVNEYVEEIRVSNGLCSDTIHAGNYIIVPYYADASR